MPYSAVEAKKIANLCEIIDCEHKTAPYIGSSEYLVVRTSNVKNGQLLMEDMKYTTETGFKTWTQRAVPEYGDVLFTREAPAGETCLVPHGLKVCMGQRMVLLRPNRKLIDPIFLSFFLATERCKSDISRLSIGSTVSRINIADIKALKIAVPPLSEQKKIAEILSTWEKAITTTEKLLANSEQQKKALMLQLLTGKKRLSGFHGEFKRSYFSDLLKIDTKNLGNSTPEDFEFEYISLSDVETGRIASKLARHRFKDAPSRARRILAEGDILLATVRPNLKGFVKIGKEHSECIASTGFSVLSQRKNVCGDYVYHYLFSTHMSAQVNALVVGTNYPAINSSDVASLTIYCPEYTEQKKIAAVLNNCDLTISKLINYLICLKNEQKALMQQLLTGKRRVQLN